MEDFINNINSVLESLYIEIKKGVTEDDGRPIYALVRAQQSPLMVFVRSWDREHLPRTLFVKSEGASCLYWL